jgi:hypothetical protein
MEHKVSFGEVLEAASKLSMDEQVTLMEILHRRVIKNRRTELALEIKSAQKEYQERCCKPTNPAELIGEILD